MHFAWAGSQSDSDDAMLHADPFDEQQIEDVDSHEQFTSTPLQASRGDQDNVSPNTHRFVTKNKVNSIILQHITRLKHVNIHMESGLSMMYTLLKN